MNKALKTGIGEDPDIDPEELIDASEERNSPIIAPELPPGLEGVVEWDTPAAAAGSVAPKTGQEDESVIGEELVQEGVEEAEREQRMAAADDE